MRWPSAVHRLGAVDRRSLLIGGGAGVGLIVAFALWPREDCALSEEELRAFLATRLAAFKIPAQFHFAGEPLPRLGTGKIDRVALKQRFSA